MTPRQCQLNSAFRHHWYDHVTTILKFHVTGRRDADYQLVSTDCIHRITQRNSLFSKGIDTGKGKVKAIPLQAWTVPELSRRPRILDFKTIGTWNW